MLRTMSDLEQLSIHATDGVVGRVQDVYFDDDAWVIRYFIVETGSWLSSRKVLISPVAINQANWADKLLSVSITKEQVKNSPSIDTQKPVSRQHEVDFLSYFGYPQYWAGPGLGGVGGYPTMTAGAAGFAVAPYSKAKTEAAVVRAESARHQNDDIHLRDCRTVLGYHVRATDGDIGKVQGILVDQDTWAIQFVIVDTSMWWSGRQVLLSPRRIHAISWGDAAVEIKLTRDEVKRSPPYDPSARPHEDQNGGLYHHFGRTGFWMAAAPHQPMIDDR